MKQFFSTLMLCTALSIAKADTYYVSVSGNDANSGKSISEAWRTIDKVNNGTYKPGDNIFFQAGQTFNGAMALEPAIPNGLPLTIGSYGGGKAIISAPGEFGIWINNTGNITIKNLVVKGIGYKLTSVWSNGIAVYTDDQPTGFLDNVIIDNVEVSGFGGSGILVGTESVNYGFRNVKITNSIAHDNGRGGIQVFGSWDDTKSLIRFSNKNVYIGNCKAYYNHGRLDYKDNWSGTGILISGTEVGLVEYCEAYENGKENGATVGGPIGIWMDDSKYVTIQYCISHHNKGGITKKDGGGFDIDGGCYGSVIQECDSYENEGAGYGFFQWATGNIWSNDTVRNNTSTNDARNPSYGALTFWGASSKHKVTNAQVYGNRISMDKSGQIITFMGNNFSNIQIHDNAICIVSPATYYSTWSSNVTESNNSFPCLVLSIKSGSFNVKRI